MLLILREPTKFLIFLGNTFLFGFNGRERVKIFKRIQQFAQNSKNRSFIALQYCNYVYYLGAKGNNGIRFSTITFALPE